MIIKFIVYLFLLLLLNNPYTPVNKQGFYCKDPTLSHIFTKETIHPNVLFVTTFIGCFFLIVFIEWMVEGSFYNIKFQKVVTKYMDFAASAVLLLVIVDALKVLVGEPRPHFLTDCKPKENDNCAFGDYIATFSCAGKKMQDLSKSFPSGHSAISLYTALYFITVLNFRWVNEETRIWKFTLIFLLICWSLICCVTRITDKKHHWWDVLAGGVLAIVYCKLQTKQII